MVKSTYDPRSIWILEQVVEGKTHAGTCLGKGLDPRDNGIQKAKPTIFTQLRRTKSFRQATSLDTIVLIRRFFQYHLT